MLSPSEPAAFEAPWQAEAYALAQVLIEAGIITPADWAEAFGARLRAASGAGEPDTTDTYFRALVATLAAILTSAQVVEASSLTDRVEGWRRAYLRTPHGQPVLLSAGLSPDPTE